MEKQMSVLIADSNEEFCGQLREKLQSQGYQVLASVADGQRALEVTTEQKPDILILDLMLPKLDGMSVLKLVGNLPQPPVCLVMSSFITDFVAASAASLGARYLMLKPCDMQAITDRLNEIQDISICAKPLSSPSMIWM